MQAVRLLAGKLRATFRRLLFPNAFLDVSLFLQDRCYRGCCICHNCQLRLAIESVDIFLPVTVSKLGYCRETKKRDTSSAR